MQQRTKDIQEFVEGLHTVHRAFAAMKKDWKGDGKHFPCPVTPSQWMALMFIARADKASVKELSENMNVSSSAATQLVNALVKQGCVKRTASPDDRRTHLLSLTKKAHASLATMQQRRIAALRKLFSALSDDEFRTYMSLQRKIVSSFIHEH